MTEKIKELHQEAQEILTVKASQIQELSDLIEEAEGQLARLKTELNIKKTQSEQGSLEETDDKDSIETELKSLREEYDKEIEELQKKHQDEINYLKANYEKAMKKAENCAKVHEETQHVQKIAELNRLKDEYERLKEEQNVKIFSKEQTKAHMSNATKAISARNSQKCRQLEHELSTIKESTQKELDQFKAKYEEAQRLIQEREKQNKLEIQKFEKEIARRKEKYDVHLKILAEQHRNEKKRIEQSICASEEKAQSLLRVVERLKKNHNEQIQQTKKDIEIMNKSIKSVSVLDEKENSAVRNTVSHNQKILRGYKQIETEINLVSAEVRELRDENQNLKNEYERLQSICSSSRTNNTY